MYEFAKSHALLHILQLQIEQETTIYYNLTNFNDSNEYINLF